ncbi:lysophospholipase NDAI_0D04780 [Naumovozyma dairenensis CBS 421]|uniref:Lysophospholipase NTE1 n=1 Tax=Naumovozyma dairenensis (strain ATCC 10597 / BCRC 20456 / CBS 421 / NBRC 0211 / NRRL Y-12639) TaxID=1071378 RepID=G0WAI0_NAUDC|nr:hypothetical protein NDAI_0D04780 [Naumovozyma dairenensis CBS 421]CCD24791.1 hypothetical protein NDAI_0D04780 [Naumovozyma dairenensis CBS 421]
MNITQDKSTPSSSSSASPISTSQERKGLPEQLIQAKHDWFLSSIGNFTWVIIYFCTGSTMFVLKGISYILTLFLLQIPGKIIHSANKMRFTISFTVILTVIAILIYITYCIVKARVLSQYKKLTPDEDSLLMNQNIGAGTNREAGSTPLNRSENMKNRNSNNINDDTFLSSYLDQFLSAIKIFGYLEKPVFHALTKNMKTQKLDEGEILLLDNSIGFAIVVEGTLQVFHEVEQTADEIVRNEARDDITEHESVLRVEALTNNDNEDLTTYNSGISDSDSDSDFDSDDESSGYIRLKNGLGKFQLLNTVKPGNPISSLVNILNLFTSANPNASPYNINGSRSDSNDRGNSNNIDMQLQFGKFTLNSDNATSSCPTPSMDTTPPLQSSEHIPALLSPYSIPKVVARASTDCTIAIIPPQAFARLTAKYPRSASHMIQMILAKLYNVTFQTAHNYLGLTREIMDIELSLNRSVKYELPYYLKETVIRKSKASNSEIKHNDSNRHARKSSFESSKPRLDSKTTSLSNDNLQAPIPAKPSRNSMVIGSRHVVLDSRDHLNPGDLLSNVPLSRKEYNDDTPARDSKSPNQWTSKANASHDHIDTKKHLKSYDRPKLKKNYQNGSSASFIKTLKTKHGMNEDIKTRSFSAAQEETEDSSVRMAVTEAFFAFMGVSQSNMSAANPETSFTDSNTNLGRSVHRSSEISLDPSIGSSVTHQTTLRILPSEYTITSRRQMKRNKKKKPYKEEISSNLDFDSAKNEFAQGLQLKFFKQGSNIVEANSDGKGMFYVISGKISVSTSSDSDDHPTNKKNHKIEHTLFSIGSGGIAGYLSGIVGYKSFVNLKAQTDVYVGFLPNKVIERLCDKYFLIYLRIAETLSGLLSSRMLKLDHALEWVHLSASETLFSQDDPANGIYVVLNGRLRQLQERKRNTTNDVNEAITHHDSKKDKMKNSTTYPVVVGELAQGESFGEVEVLTAMNRFTTIVAVRDSELARIPRTLFESIAMEHPSIMIRVSRLVAKKIMGNNYTQNNEDNNLAIPLTKSLNSLNSHYQTQNHSSGKITFRTITILPIREGLPVENFAMKLVQAFKQVGRNTIGLNQRTTLTHLGRHAFDRLAKLKQSGYFAELEEMYQTVVYIADTPSKSSWTQTCIAQGDCILLLADATSLPDIGEYENLLLKSKTTARTELILLHPERYVEPGLTQKWLRYRPWVHSHHHIQLVVNPLEGISANKIHGFNGGALALVDKFIQTDFSKKTQQNISKLLPDSLKTTVENFSSRFMKKRNAQFYTPTNPHKNDFLRLARILSGQAIGLVLGGGGARGLSHLGVIQAIEEQGIPIDMIGGTSIGSFVGGLYAKDYDLVPIYGRVKKFAGRISSLWRTLLDLTWPVTSYTTGHEFNRGIWKTFGDTRIEDFWIQYYCNSTNITNSVQEIHSFGYAWRYIRASMSLAGLLPPLEEHGSMLLDGGYLDNLPVLEMKARGCDTIFAVDVGSVDDRTPMKYGDSLNGFWIVFNRWNPFSSHPNVPNMAEIQVRLGYVASVNALEKAKNTAGVLYIRPPIENYATLDFGKFEEIYAVGVDYGRIFFQELESEGKMPFLPGCQAQVVASEVPEFLLHRRHSI